MMSLLRTSMPPDNDQQLQDDTVYLRAPIMSDFPQWVTLRASSREFLRPWEPIWPVDDLTRGAFRRRLRRYAQERREGRCYPFLLFSLANDRLLGGATISNVRRGVTQACSLGYWMGEEYAGKGFMTKAVALIMPFCFDVLRLHRIEAACLPHNQPSQHLLEKVGFTKEGYARRYLCINGEWRDHLLFACVSDDARPLSRVTLHNPATDR